MIGGLRGIDRVKYRQWIRLADDDRVRELSTEAHDPELDEHNFICSESPMMFPDAGTYEMRIDVEIATHRAT